ncbi:uncharacterized protein BDZ83DRAFT_732297 [Colletotrichum acutatum]|uniref:Uncharacterized protein n=1 Tax=Glomerella acutata TaxID=27357 RepID=A0AAD8UJD7_GLOAC|nr:uncharacterized protein BDZ83DRAFT_732297 [Colletotrichum acutatum]KAK1722839.1 hypothetical protein BDZ83DRAFT_732297 [Colletotrichum acutatum]
MSGDPELPRRQHLEIHHRMRPRHNVFQPPQRRRPGIRKPTGLESTPYDHNLGPMCVGKQSAIDAFVCPARTHGTIRYKATTSGWQSLRREAYKPHVFDAFTCKSSAVANLPCCRADALNHESESIRGFYVCGLCWELFKRKQIVSSSFSSSSNDRSQQGLQAANVPDGKLLPEHDHDNSNMLKITELRGH